MGLLASGKTDVGMKRKSNQDSIYYSVPERFFMVADGMGGHKGGDVASQIAVDEFPKHINKLISSNEEYDFNLKKALENTNQAILNHAIKNPIVEGMGTTLVSLLFTKSHLYITNVGDSRAYLLNSKGVYQLTIDHSLVQEKIEAGIYTREDASKDPMKNVLTRTVGYEEKVETDVFTYKVLRGDLFLLCSDGLHGKVSDIDMFKIINNVMPDISKATQSDINLACELLVEWANKNGGNDNISVILVAAQ